MSKRIKIVAVSIFICLFVTLFIFYVQNANTIIVNIDPTDSGYEISAMIPAKDTVNTIIAMEYDTEDYFLFLPSYAQGKRLSIDCPNKTALSVKDSAFLSSLSSKEQQYEIDGHNLTIMIGSELPTVYLDLKKELAYLKESKDNRSKGQMTIADDNGEAIFGGKLERINGRGNNSWHLDKKSYVIRLKDEVSLFGMDSEKKYVLAASSDLTLMRNRISNEMAKTMDAKIFKRQSVSLYINGDYQGVYEICEKPALDRLDIYNLEEATLDLNKQNKEPNQETTGEYCDDWNSSPTGKWWDYPDSPPNNTGGYLLEADDTSRYGEEASGFILDSGAYIVSKSPELLTKKQYDYISSYVQGAENVMIDSINIDNYDALEEYIDIPSFVKKYLIEEVSKNVDCSTTSQFFYKDMNGVITAGPPWDYDWAYGVVRDYNEIDFANPEGYSARDIPGAFKWWQLLYYNNAFYEDICTEYENVLYPWIGEMTEQTLWTWEEELRDSAAMEFIRFNYAESCDIPTVRKFYHNEVKWVADFMNARRDFLYREWIQTE